MKLRVMGHEAHVYTGGRPPGRGLPAVVLVHGAGMDHSVWIHQSRYLAHHGHEVLAVDLPGHGRSAGPCLTSIADMADWITALADAAGHERFALVGHSMGALVALEAAARSPQRARTVVLLGVAAPMPVADLLLDAARDDPAAANDMVTLWGLALRAQLGANPAPGMWMTGGVMRLLERAGPGVLHADLRACNDYTSGLEAAARIGCPVHLLLGGADRMTPRRAAMALTEALTAPQVVDIPGCGHMSMVERPDAVLDAMVAALAAPVIPA
ncbi:MAG: alpha/beta hydrolase [Ectothiorhodospiraceae bacterium]|nr:alpha/beta hydrolase [Chromatiales bacterium]MCP5156027.1 alpha/beta hydrolase [Ectothiorhodospiraceae bacterium]